MSNRFSRAVRRQRKSKGLVYGISGAGKTYCALSIAEGLANGKPIALIDSEDSSSELYSDNFEFDVCNLRDHSVDEYLSAVNDAVAAEYEVIIVDSLTHGWNWIKDQVNLRLPKYKYNAMLCWNEFGTPENNRLVFDIIKADAHIIVTARAKADYVDQEINSGGKTKTVKKKVGTAASVRADFEYEFDWVGTIDIDHILQIEKSRYDFLADRVIKKPTAELGVEMREWLAGGADPTVNPAAWVLEKSKLKGSKVGDMDRKLQNSAISEHRDRFSKNDLKAIEAFIEQLPE